MSFMLFFMVVMAAKLSMSFDVHIVSVSNRVFSAINKAAIKVIQAFKGHSFRVNTSKDSLFFFSN